MAFCMCLSQGHFGPINSLAFNPDGKSFASGSEDGYIRLHHFDTDYIAKHGTATPFRRLMSAIATPRVYALLHHFDVKCFDLFSP
jgi:WD40 repeat protein